MNYLIHNGSRARHNRTKRAALPQHGGHKQYVCKSEFRLIRGQPLTITEDQLLEHQEELMAKEDQGLLFVTDMERRPVNLETLEVGPAALPSPPPDSPMDSAADDAASGLVMSQFNDPPPPKEFEMPVEQPAAADLPLPSLESAAPVKSGKGKR